MSPPSYSAARTRRRSPRLQRLAQRERAVDEPAGRGRARSVTDSVASPAVEMTVAVVLASYVLSMPGVNAPNAAGAPSDSDSVAGTVPPTVPPRAGRAVDRRLAVRRQHDRPDEAVVLDHAAVLDRRVQRGQPVVEVVATRTAIVFAPACRYGPTSTVGSIALTLDRLPVDRERERVGDLAEAERRAVARVPAGREVDGRGVRADAGRVGQLRDVRPRLQAGRGRARPGSCWSACRRSRASRTGSAAASPRRRGARSRR